MTLQAESITAHQTASPSDSPKLATVDFPTSAQSKAAQVHFLRGVAALHSFWYPTALDEFQAATRLEPEFMMGYWGEAMTHNHPLWGDQQETEAARNVLAKITITPRQTPLEIAYLQAITVLYGEGDKPVRDQAYTAAMEQLYREHPDDLEAAAFYALALLGIAHPNDPTALRTRMKAAAVALEVYRREPNHPGAAHYIIHAFDDPDHAILALPIARHYVEMAPPGHHAQHMPLHVFQRLGMWSDAAAANEAAWEASDQWVRSNNLPLSRRDYHSLHWLFYSYLQQGRYREAEQLWATMQKSLEQFPKDDPRMLAYGAYIDASMAAAMVIETERWENADTLLPAVQNIAQSSQQPDGAGSHSYQAFMAVTRIPTIFARGLAAAMRGSPQTQDSVSALRTIREQSRHPQEPVIEQMTKMAEIYELQISAVADVLKGKVDQAVAMLRKASALEEAASPPGPLLKPSHELYGELLLRVNHSAEAAQQFEKALFHYPNRARSLLGAARAAAQSGDRPGATQA